MHQPNFFIIGAPKCGTTSLSEYLRGHPNVYMSVPKEPYFFSTDLNIGFLSSLDEYLTKCFPGVDRIHLAVGEASAWYLYSETAIPNILDFNPAAKFIVMVRNPIDMFRSLHFQMIFERNEKFDDASIAWHLQKRRRTGHDIPRLCLEPKFLQYGAACRLGNQLARLYGLVAKEHIKVIVFDDFIANTALAYKEVIDFLDLPSDAQMDFKIFNRSKKVRLKLLADVIAAVVRSPRLLHAFQTVKRLGGIEVFGLSGLNTRRQRLQALPTELKLKLVDYFRDDINLLSELIARDLSPWCDVNPDSGV